MALHILLVKITSSHNNYFNATTHKELDALLDWANMEPEIWVVILTGNGKVFSLGEDISHFLQNTNTSNYINLHPKQKGFGGLALRRKFKKILICALDGNAFDGGLELVLSCDLIVATKDALLGFLDVRHGLTVSLSAFDKLIELVGSFRTMETLLLAKHITSEEAVQLGIINCVVNKRIELLSKSLEIAKNICALSPNAVQLYKTVKNAKVNRTSIEDINGVKKTAKFAALTTGLNFKESVQASVSKRQPKWVSPKI